MSGVDTQDAVPTTIGQQIPEANSPPVGGIGQPLAHPPIPSDRSEHVAHIKEYNVVDPIFMNQYFFLTTFFWSINRKAGDLLWSTPITPYQSFANLEWLSKMYNSWSGSMMYAFGIAGTGFMGGKLRIVKYPPNIVPKSSSIKDYTMYPYFYLDPKELAYAGMDATDVRNTLFHWAGNSLNRDDIGGYVAIHVELPLVGADITGVNVEVLMKLGPDFTFAQMIPPINDIVPDPVIDTGNFGKFHLSENKHPIIDSLPLERMLILGRPDFGFNQSLVTMNGDSRMPQDLETNLPFTFGALYSVPSELERYLVLSSTYNTHPTFTDLSTYDFCQMTMKQGVMVATDSGSGVVRHADIFHLVNTHVISELFVDESRPDLFLTCSQVPSFTKSKDYSLYEGAYTSDPPSQTNVFSPLGESIVVFGSRSDSNSGVYQTLENRTLLKQKIFANIPEAFTPVFVIRDTVTGLLLGRVRLNRNGFFTTSPTTTVTALNLSELELVFEELLPANSSLPVDGQMLLNQQMKYIISNDLQRNSKVN